MDWLFFYQVGAVVTAAIAVFTIFYLEDMSERERWDLAMIFAFGLVVWPGMLYGLIALVVQAHEHRRAA